MAVIVLIKEASGDSFGLFFPGRYVLGRSSKCDVVIKDTQISGQHCSLELSEAGKIIFTDMGSTNGSFLGNNKITGHELKVGESIRIGGTHLTIDESSLTIAEKNIIGKVKSSIDNNLTLPNLSPSQVAKIQSEKATEETKSEKKSIVQVKNKALTKGQPKEITVAQNERLLEQEESSGTTKMLKLNNIFKKNKK